MPTSQFKFYISSDPGGPGPMTGEAGKVLTIFDACLVNGYPGKTAAGWTKPIANSGNYGCYKQGAGCEFAFLINDNGPNATSTFKEAWATGWETVTALTDPVGAGYGQFPLPTQLLTTGHVVVRKSATADTVPRQWVMFADSRTMYFFVQTGDVTGAYMCFAFGDLFSFGGASDRWCCQIIGRSTENTGTETPESFAAFAGNATFNAVSGTFLARSFTGLGFSITRGQNGDTGKAYASGYSSGVIPGPNGPDNSYYIVPITVHEPVGTALRGRMRGVYQVCHPNSGFSDGQQIAGVGDYSGKTFQIVKNVVSGVSGTTSNCFVAIEISNTVETN